MIVHLVLIQKWHFLYLSWMSMNWKTEKTCWTLMKRQLQKCSQMFWSILFSGLFLWKFDVLHSKFTLKVNFLSRMSFDFCDISNLSRKFCPRFVAPFETSGALILGLTRFWSTVPGCKRLFSKQWLQLPHSVPLGYPCWYRNRRLFRG